MHHCLKKKQKCKRGGTACRLTGSRGACILAGFQLLGLLLPPSFSNLFVLPRLGSLGSWLFPISAWLAVSSSLVQLKISHFLRTVL